MGLTTGRDTSGGSWVEATACSAQDGRTAEHDRLASLAGGLQQGLCRLLIRKAGRVGGSLCMRGRSRPWCSCPVPLGLRAQPPWRGVCTRGPGLPWTLVLRTPARAAGESLKPWSSSEQAEAAGPACRGLGTDAPAQGGFSVPQIQHTEDMENEIDELLQEFEEKSGRAFLHTVCFY